MYGEAPVAVFGPYFEQRNMSQQELKRIDREWKSARSPRQHHHKKQTVRKIVVDFSMPPIEADTVDDCADDPRLRCDVQRAMVVSHQKNSAAGSQQKKKKKPKPPGNLCWEWRQQGICPRVAAGGKCKMSHDPDWRGKSLRKK